MFYYKQETNYEAPKWMEGEYKLKVHGRKITIERLSVADGGVPTKSHATCHKHDQFDIGDGAKVALDRLKDKAAKFKVGDNVKIVDAGFAYIEKWDCPVEFAARYRYGIVPEDGLVGEIVGWYDMGESIAIVDIFDDRRIGQRYATAGLRHSIYLIDTQGLKKV